MTEELPVSLFLFRSHGTKALDLRINPNNILLASQLITPQLLRHTKNILLFKDTGSGKSADALNAAIQYLQFGDNEHPKYPDLTGGDYVNTIANSPGFAPYIIVLTKSNHIGRKIRDELLRIVAPNVAKQTPASTGVNQERLRNSVMNKTDSRIRFMTYEIFAKYIMQDMYAKFSTKIPNLEKPKDIAAIRKLREAKLNLRNAVIICDEVHHLLIPKKGSTKRDRLKERIENTDYIKIKRTSFKNPKVGGRIVGITNRYRARMHVPKSQGGSPVDIGALIRLWVIKLIGSGMSFKPTYWALLICKYLYNVKLILLTATPLRSKLETINRLSTLLTDIRTLATKINILKLNPIFDPKTLGLKSETGSYILERIPEINRPKDLYGMKGVNFTNISQAKMPRLFTGQFSEDMNPTTMKELSGFLKPFYPGISRLESNTGIEVNMMGCRNWSSKTIPQEKFATTSSPIAISRGSFGNGEYTYQGYNLLKSFRTISEGVASFMVEPRTLSIISSPSDMPSKVDPALLFSFASTFADLLQETYKHPKVRKALYYSPYVEKGLELLSDLLVSIGLAKFNPSGGEYSIQTTTDITQEAVNGEEEEDVDTIGFEEIEETIDDRTNEEIYQEEIEENIEDEEIDIESPQTNVQRRPKQIAVSLYDDLVKSAKSRKRFTVSKKPRFTLGSSVVPVATAIREAYNDPANWNGDYISMALIPPALTEGVDFKEGTVLGMHVEFNWSLMLQVMGRMNRLASHDLIKQYLGRDLPLNVYMMQMGLIEYTNLGDVEDIFRNQLLRNLYWRFSLLNSSMGRGTSSYIYAFAKLKCNLIRVIYKLSRYTDSPISNDEYTSLLTIQYNDYRKHVSKSSETIVSKLEQLATNGKDLMHGDTFKAFINIYRKVGKCIAHVHKKLKDNIKTDNLFRDEIFTLGYRYLNVDIGSTKMFRLEKKFHDTAVEILSNVDIKPSNVEIKYIRVLGYWMLDIEECLTQLKISAFKYILPTIKVVKALRLRQTTTYWYRRFLTNLALDRDINFPVPSNQIDKKKYYNDLYYINDVSPYLYNQLIEGFKEIIEHNGYMVHRAFLNACKQYIKKSIPRIQYALEILNPNEANLTIINWIRNLDTMTVSSSKRIYIRISNKYIGLYNSLSKVSDDELKMYDRNRKIINIVTPSNIVYTALYDSIDWKYRQMNSTLELMLPSQLEIHVQLSLVNLMLAIAARSRAFTTKLDGTSDYTSLISWLTNLNSRVRYEFSESLETVYTSIATLNYTRSSLMYIMMDETKVGREMVQWIDVPTSDQEMLQLIDKINKEYKSWLEDPRLYRDIGKRLVIVSRIKEAHRSRLLTVKLNSISSIISFNFNILRKVIASHDKRMKAESEIISTPTRRDIVNYVSENPNVQKNINSELQLDFQEIIPDSQREIIGLSPFAYIRYLTKDLLQTLFLEYIFAIRYYNEMSHYTVLPNTLNISFLKFIREGLKEKSIEHLSQLVITKKIKRDISDPLQAISKQGRRLIDILKENQDRFRKQLDLGFDETKLRLLKTGYIIYDGNTRYLDAPNVTSIDASISYKSSNYKRGVLIYDLLTTSIINVYISILNEFTKGYIFNKFKFPPHILKKYQNMLKPYILRVSIGDQNLDYFIQSYQHAITAIKSWRITSGSRNWLTASKKLVNVSIKFRDYTLMSSQEKIDLYERSDSVRIKELASTIYKMLEFTNHIYNIIPRLPDIHFTDHVINTSHIRSESTRDLNIKKRLYISVSIIDDISNNFSADILNENELKLFSTNSANYRKYYFYVKKYRSVAITYIIQIPTKQRFRIADALYLADNSASYSGLFDRPYEHISNVQSERIDPIRFIPDQDEEDVLILFENDQSFVRMDKLLDRFAKDL